MLGADRKPLKPRREPLVEHVGNVITRASDVEVVNSSVECNKDPFGGATALNNLLNESTSNTILEARQPESGRGLTYSLNTN